MASPKWIWRDNFNGNNLTCWFKKSFILGSVSTKAVLCCSANNYLRVFVNGKEVSGVVYPANSVATKTKYYIPFDVSHLLVRGENTISALVLYLGNHGQNHAHAPAGLWASLRCGKYSVFSDETWLCSADTGYLQNMPAKEQRRLSPQTIFYGDGSSLTWENAVESKLQDINPVIRRQEIPDGIVRRAVPLKRLGTTPEGAVVFDLGEIITGYVEVRASGMANAKMTLRYAELLKGQRRFHGDTANAEPVAALLGVEHSAANDKTETYTDSYIFTRGGESGWAERMTYKAFRYVEFSTEGQIELLDIMAYKTGTGICCKTSLFSDSAFLEWLFYTAVETQYNALQGMLVDCPHREQAQYLGDSLMQSYLLEYNFDYFPQMMGKVLRDFADAQLEQGNFPFVAPIDFSEFPLLMPEYDFNFVTIMNAISRYENNTGCLKIFYPHAKSMVMFYLKQSEGGLIPKDDNEYHIPDWPYPTVDQDGNYFAVQNMLMIKTLEQMGSVAENLSEYEEACFWKDEEAKAKAAFTKAFFDERAGLFRDTEISCKHNKGVQALGAKFGLFSIEQMPRVLDYLAEEPFETGIIRSYDLLDVLFSHGRKQEAWEFISNPARRWGKMFADGRTTFLEGFEDIESHSHAWTGHPLRLIQEHLLGVSTKHINDNIVEINAWLPPGINLLKGSVNTPKGIVFVKLERIGETLNVKAAAPDGIKIKYI